MNDPALSVTAFLLLIGGITLGAGLQPLVDHGWNHESRFRVVASAGVGASLIGVGFLWSRLTGLQESAFGESLTAVATNALWWLVLVFLLWGYLAFTNITLLRQRDNTAYVIRRHMMPFQLALQKWVIPRTLAREQRNALVDYLRQFAPPPYPVQFIVREHDQEADAYRSELQSALGEAGWSNAKRIVKPDVQTGLRLRHRHTPDTNYRSNNQNELTPDKILIAAFQEAGIKLSGTSSGSGQSTTEDEIMIEIGERRRDSHGDVQPWLP